MQKPRPSGGYRKLASFQIATLIYDATYSAVRANAIICLIHQANYLLDKQIAALEQQFICDGPNCGGPMTLRTAKQGIHAGQQILGMR